MVETPRPSGSTNVHVTKITVGIPEMSVLCIMYLRIQLTVFAILLGGIAMVSSAQGHHVDGSDQGNTGHHKPFRVALASLNSYVPALNSNRHFVIPAWAVEAEYRFAKHWAIAAHVELELLTYLVEGEGEEETLEREYPIITGLLLVYELPRNVILSAGYGFEHEKSTNFHLITFTTGYQIKLPKHWDITPGVTYNSRINAFDTWSLNIGFGKSF